ncbi:MAG: terpene cyclase/mutase family protein [Planctomycetes bacterium]|nr:terpene cyclase/mutase family protein [Planctomycetota bacterium]
MKKHLVYSWILLLGLIPLFTIGAENVNEAVNKNSNQPEITTQAIQAIDKGLKYFADHQLKNGSLGGGYPVAATSLAGLTWLASGHTPHRGKYSENIRRALKYIIGSQLKNGFIAGSDTQSGMYGHGYSTLFLSESFGMLEDETLYEEVHDALKKAVHLLENSQNQFGGWNTAPDAQATDDGSGAVAIMQITALRAARNAGIWVNSGTINKAKKYIQEMTTADGWYQYNYGSRGGGHRSSALTGAGMYMMGAMDLYNEDKYKKGIQNLLASAPFLGGKNPNDQGWTSWYLYTCFYSSLAIYQYGGADWVRWYAAIREELIKQQTNEGLWTNDAYGGIYSAFAMLTLQLPYRYLPIFQEGGRGAEGQ